MDILLGALVFVVVIVIAFFGERFGGKFSRMFSEVHQFGTRVVVAFLSGFIVFAVFTGRIANPVQKIPLIIVCALLIWANIFLVTQPGDESQAD
jgi:hypothetical protein